MLPSAHDYLTQSRHVTPTSIPKIPQNIRGTPMTGPGLALLIERMVDALNARDLPSAGSMLEYFNREVRPNTLRGCHHRNGRRAVHLNHDLPSIQNPCTLKWVQSVSK